jgi:hypothetical protein
MDLVVPHSAFASQKLTVRTAGFFTGPKVLLNGVAVKPVKRQYLVRDDHGNEVALRLKSNFVDPIPVVLLGGQPVRLARALTWYEYAWIGIPILLLFVGGALGAVIGVLATYTSSHIFRSGRTVASKYLLTALVTVSSIVVFVVAVVAIQAVIGPRK